MADVVLSAKSPKDNDKVNYMIDTLQSKYNTFLLAREHKLQDGTVIWFTRLSAQIYLELSDYTLMAERVVELLS